jgi:hypothetical protein
MNQSQSAQWWGDFSFDIEQTILWEIGPLKLAIERRQSEWRIAYEQNEAFDPKDEQPLLGRVDHNAPNPNDLEFSRLERYALGQTGRSLTILPALADRPVITRPITPFTVPADTEAALYASSPLWIQIFTGMPTKKLSDLPTRRPSDTWFGPNTMEGELCYASRTHGRLTLSNLQVLPHRAITQITIRNTASSSLQVERINLPVPYLSLFTTSDGSLWTEKVAMIHTREMALVDFQISTALSAPAKAERVNVPRQQIGQSIMIRAFGALLRQF